MHWPFTRRCCGRTAAAAFAQEGKARATERLQLADSLQALIDHPGALASARAREQAAELLQTAEDEPSPGPVLREQIARRRALLPGADRPVHLSLVSDSLTQVSIPNVGTLRQLRASRRRA